MTSDLMDKLFLKVDKSGNHYKDFHIQPYEFISKNNFILSR